VFACPSKLLTNCGKKEASKFCHRRTDASSAAFEIEDVEIEDIGIR